MLVLFKRRSGEVDPSTKLFLEHGRRSSIADVGVHLFFAALVDHRLIDYRA